MTRFVALFEDAVKVENAARAAGCADAESWLDYVEPADYRTACGFKSKSQAVAHIKGAVKRGLTVFGCGEVLEIEDTPVERRCKWCICRGERTVRRLLVNDQGIESDWAEDDCAGE